jgi:acyl carrier protein
MGFFSKKKSPSAVPAVTPAAVSPVRTPSTPTDGRSPMDSVGSNDEIERALRECIAQLSDGKLTASAIDPRAHLFDFGYVDSFKSAELLSFIQKRWGVDVPEIQLVGRLNTLDALARHIQTQNVKVR